MDRVNDHWERENVRITFVTGGWSGNESIMSVLNRTLFTMFWRESNSGGRHVFETSHGIWEHPFDDFAPVPDPAQRVFGDALRWAGATADAERVQKMSAAAWDEFYDQVIETRQVS